MNKHRIILTNKKLSFKYFIYEKIEAGMVLQGWEIKSIIAGNFSLNESYVTIINEEVWIKNSSCTALLYTRPEEAIARKDRKLLLHKKQINTLIGKVKQQGFSLGIVDLHWSKRKIKAEIALVKGKKDYDKRQALKEKEWNDTKQSLLKHDY